jgi:hypothetical protein
VGGAGGSEIQIKRISLCVLCDSVRDKKTLLGLAFKLFKPKMRRKDKCLIGY